MNAMLHIWIIVFVVLLTLSPTFGNEYAERRPEAIQSNHGAVASDDRRCSRIGRDVLKEGGHVVDATVATILCLGVVSSASSGIGGGAFMVLRLANGKAQAFDSREIAPRRASENMYGGNSTLKSSGALSIAVPGELLGLHEAWKLHGNLPWPRLVLPSAHLARRYTISPYLHMQMIKTEQAILADEGLRQIFAPNGSLLKEGDLCRNDRLARTLGDIARFGSRVLYRGFVGRELVKDVREIGGIMTMRDLGEYRVRITEPMYGDVMGVRIIGMPLPSSGGAGMILVFLVLSGFID